MRSDEGMSSQSVRVQGARWREWSRWLGRYGLGAVLGVLLVAANAGACGTKHGLPDRDCDGAVRVVVLGDSFVKGIGDTKNSNSGGYVIRTAKALRKIIFKPFGKPGLEARQLLKQVNDSFAASKDSPLKEALITADYVVLDLGRNDRWYFESPAKTARHLKRIRLQIEKGVGQLTGGFAPLVVTAVLMLPNRGAQGPWVKDLNVVIRKGDALDAPADLRFDRVSKRLLSNDQLHPTSLGYAALAETFVTYLTKTLPARLGTARQ
jgi:lysophospholipase L1-like esterase